MSVQTMLPIRNRIQQRRKQSNGKGETMSTAGKIMSFRQDGNEICVKYEQQKLVVKAIRDDIVNIFVPYRTKEHYSKAIDGDKAVATELTAEQRSGNCNR
jgi:hypothetical protein